MYNYTQNEWGTGKVATAHKEIKFLQGLNSADPDNKMHVVRMKRMKKSLRTSGKDLKLHSERVGKMQKIHSQRV